MRFTEGPLVVGLFALMYDMSLMYVGCIVKQDQIKTFDFTFILLLSGEEPVTCNVNM